jgi:acetyl-CoA carboxylase biotin carboxylase subunit
MLCALDDYVIGGIQTNLSLFRRILLDPAFRAAAIDTSYLERLLAQPDDNSGWASAEPTAPAQSQSSTSLERSAAVVPTEISALAAAIFATQPSAPTQSETHESPWALTARREALRT